MLCWVNGDTLGREEVERVQQKSQPVETSMINLQIVAWKCLEKRCLQTLSLTGHTDPASGAGDRSICVEFSAMSSYKGRWFLITTFHRNTGERIVSLLSILREWAACYKGDWERVRRNIPGWTIWTIFLCTADCVIPMTFHLWGPSLGWGLTHSSCPDLLSNDEKKNLWWGRSARALSNTS